MTRFLYRKLHISTHIKSTWKKNAHFGHNNVCATQTNAPYVSVTKTRFRRFGSKRRNKINFHKYRQRINWISENSTKASNKINRKDKEKRMNGVLMNWLIMKMIKILYM